MCASSTSYGSGFLEPLLYWLGCWCGNIIHVILSASISQDLLYHDTWYFKNSVITHCRFYSEEEKRYLFPEICLSLKGSCSSLKNELFVQHTHLLHEKYFCIKYKSSLGTKRGYTSYHFLTKTLINVRFHMYGYFLSSSHGIKC